MSLDNTTEKADISKRGVLRNYTFVMNEVWAPKIGVE